MEHGKVNLYGATYEQFTVRVYAEIREKASDEDIGQTGWLTADETVIPHEMEEE